MDEMLIFGGSASPRLARNICEYLGVPLGASEVLHFSEGNLFVRIQENVRGRRVYLVQSTAFPTSLGGPLCGFSALPICHEHLNQRFPPNRSLWYNSGCKSRSGSR